MEWLEHGDCNTRFFHTSLKIRRHFNKVNIIREDGSVLSEDDAAMAAVDFYKSLFGQYTHPVFDGEFSNFGSVISSEENEWLISCPSMDEIWMEVKSMDPNSSPGPDGFLAQFYISQWDVIKLDLHEAIKAFFQGLTIPNIISSTHIFLLPKIPNATSLDKLRPISLCNVIHKIISRILNTRLSKFLPRFISEEQSGFMQGRSIHESIALAHDLTQDLKNKNFGSNIMIKLDMSKAYDRVSWSFILSVLKAAGFSESWCDLIYRCISNSWYSIKWNGRCKGYFKSFCGVRQGDPLSPSLFLIAMEWFTRAINKEVQDGRIRPYYSGIHIRPVSHLLFADDMLIFTNGHWKSVSNLMQLINNFCNFSGQQLNTDKSLIFFPDHIDHRRKRRLLRDTKFSEGTFPTMYLGAPLYIGSPRISFFNYLEEKVRSKISGWMRSMLSMAGRLTLIKSVLNCMSIHCMAVLPVPKTILHRITCIIRDFLWDPGDHKRHHWIGWDKICKPICAGGLGINSLEDIMLSMHGKLAWKCHSGSSLWARTMRQRYNDDRKGSNMWNNIAHLVDHMKENCSWILGNGDIKTDQFCTSIGLTAPSHLAPLAIKDVIHNMGFKEELFQVLPVRHKERLISYFPSPGADRLVWDGHQSGLFTTKSFRESFATKHENLKWCSIIWQRWIPKRISCFTWRMCFRGISTDDNVHKLSIPLASVCVCCEKAEETQEHLFFHGELSNKVWGFLSSVFSTAQPHDITSFTRRWIGDKPPTTFVGALKIAMACISVWEIWNFRNELIHYNRRSDVIKSICKWTFNIQKLIKLPFRDTAPNKRRLQMLGLPVPVSVPAVPMRTWYPNSVGWTACVAIVNNAAGIVVRDSNSQFKLAAVQPVRLHGLHGLITTMKKAISLCLDAGQNQVTLHSSNIYVGDLLFAKEEELPCDVVYLRRRFLHDHNTIPIHRINANRNNPAIALACKGSPGIYLRMDNLPWVVIRALERDSIQLPIFGRRFDSD